MSPTITGPPRSGRRTYRPRGLPADTRPCLGRLPRLPAGRRAPKAGRHAPGRVLAAGVRVRRRHARHHPADPAVCHLPGPVAFFRGHRHGDLRRLRRRGAGHLAVAGWSSDQAAPAGAGAALGPARRTRSCSSWPRTWACSWPGPRPGSRPDDDGTATAMPDRPDPGLGEPWRVSLTATAANMGGLGLGPLIAGLFAQYAPHPTTLVFEVYLAVLASRPGLWFIRRRSARAVGPLALRWPRDSRAGPGEFIAAAGAVSPPSPCRAVQLGGGPASSEACCRTRAATLCRARSCS